MRISDWSSDVCSSDLRDQLAEAARLHRDNGFTALKSVVAVDKGGWREDAGSVRIIREAVGDDIDLMIDANYLFNPVEAKYLCRAIEDCSITWFKEPRMQNNARALAELHHTTQHPLPPRTHAGQPGRLGEMCQHPAGA